MQKDYYLNQKKAMEINPRHPLIKELLRRVEDNPEDAVAKDMSLMMFQTATLRSGYMVKQVSQKKKLVYYKYFCLFTSNMKFLFTFAETPQFLPTKLKA